MLQLPIRDGARPARYSQTVLKRSCTGQACSNGFHSSLKAGFVAAACLRGTLTAGQSRGRSFPTMHANAQSLGGCDSYAEIAFANVKKDVRLWQDGRLSLSARLEIGAALRRSHRAVAAGQCRGPKRNGCFQATNLAQRRSAKGRERILSQLPGTGRSPRPLKHAFLAETREGVVRKTIREVLRKACVAAFAVPLLGQRVLSIVDDLPTTRVRFRLIGMISAPSRNLSR